MVSVLPLVPDLFITWILGSFSLDYMDPTSSLLAAPGPGTGSRADLASDPDAKGLGGGRIQIQKIPDP